MSQGNRQGLLLSGAQLLGVVLLGLGLAAAGCTSNGGTSTPRTEDQGGYERPQGGSQPTEPSRRPLPPTGR